MSPFYFPVADPGEGPGGSAAPLLLDQTEVRGAQKIVLGHRLPPYLRAAKGLDRVWMTAPSPSPPPLPVRWGSPPVHLISHFVRSRSFTGMVTRREGLPDLPDGVILSAGLTCKRFRWGYQPSWGRIGVTSNSRHIRAITMKSDNS